MYDFVSHILRRYFEATGWNEYNSYLNLTASSSSILDFDIPSGFSLSISASPTPAFFTSYRLAALPTLRGGIGYIYSSTDTPLDFGRSSKDVRFKDVVERFRVVEAPKRPQGKDQVWLAGKRVDARDYLIYGCMHVPHSRLDALFTTRLSPTWQLILTAVSTPPRYPLSAIPSSVSLGDKPLDASTSNLSSSVSSTNVASSPPGTTNLQLTLQNDTGRWFTEYSYSADDALWGLRVLHNFGAADVGAAASSASAQEWQRAERARSKRRINEDEAGFESVVGGGLRGRFSAGAEVFVSTVEKSAGLSTGIRFATLPDDAGAPPSQPPTIITAQLNPMMGHLSTAYAARMARDLAVCSRFDFNVYSYDSELTFGAEYWLRSSANPASALRQTPSRQAKEKSPMSLRDDHPPSPSPPALEQHHHPSQPSVLNKISGVLKARISTTSDIRLLWQGRLRNCLVSLGVRADLNPHMHKPSSARGILKSVGVEVMYFSEASDADVAGLVGAEHGQEELRYQAAM